MMADECAIGIPWTGKTREAIESNLYALYEMGDISEGAYRAFRRHSDEVRFASEEEARDALDEMEYMLGGGHPEIHDQTLREKVKALTEKLEDK